MLETLPRHRESCRCSLKGSYPTQTSTQLLWHSRGELDKSAAGGESQAPEECLSEPKKEKEQIHGLLTAGSECGLSQIMDCKKFGSFERLIRTTTLVLKFCRKLLNIVRMGNSEDHFDPRAEDGP